MPRGKPNSSVEERFIRKTTKVDCIYPEMTHCHIWIGGIRPDGYGQVLPRTYEGANMAHQWACHHWNGSPLPIVKGMCVAHKCDTKLCVNPEHLEYVTLQENIRQMYERNPIAMGRVVPTEEQLQIIRECLPLVTGKIGRGANDDMSMREIGRRVKHSVSWVDRVIKDYF